MLSDRAARRRERRPELESLEARRLLYATTGGQWAYGSRITYSFMPDGTNIGGYGSTLYQSLEAQGFSDATWQAQIMRAAAVWEAVAGINLARVADDGSPVGVAGDQQDDPRFGDIRIGGLPQSLSQLAFAFATPPFNGGTLAGDIVLNTYQAWQVNGNPYDLETVAIHELGHALGMAHSQIQSAVMYAYYTDAKQSLTSDDSAGIQSIYGPVVPDGFEGTYGNYSLSTAASITRFINPYLSQIALSNLRINAQGQEWFSVVVPASTTGTMTVAVQSGNLSSLSPGVAVLSSPQQVVAVASAKGSYGWGGWASVSFPVSAGQVYFIRASGADYGASAQGGYGLLVNFGPYAMSYIAPPNTVVAQQPDQGGGTMPDRVLGPEASGDTSPGNSGWGHWNASTDTSETGSRQPTDRSRGPGRDASTDTSETRTARDDGLHTIRVGRLSGLGDELVVAPTAPAVHPGRGPVPAAPVPGGPLVAPVIVPLVAPGAGAVPNHSEPEAAPFSRAWGHFRAVDAALAMLRRGLER